MQNERERENNKLPSLRILLVDDNAQFLEVAARTLATVPAIEIVGRALSGRDALEQVTQLQPDLVLMDVAMPNMNGLEATRHIKAQPGAPRVVMLTLHDSLSIARQLQRLARMTLSAKPNSAHGCSR